MTGSFNFIFYCFMFLWFSLIKQNKVTIFRQDISLSQNQIHWCRCLLGKCKFLVANRYSRNSFSSSVSRLITHPLSHFVASCDKIFILYIIWNNSPGYTSGAGSDGGMPGSSVSVSGVGLAVYSSWGILFLSLIAILFFLACTPCQRSTTKSKTKWSFFWEAN